MLFLIGGLTVESHCSELWVRLTTLIRLRCDYLSLGWRWLGLWSKGETSRARLFPRPIALFATHYQAHGDIAVPIMNPLDRFRDPFIQRSRLTRRVWWMGTRLSRTNEDTYEFNGVSSIHIWFFHPSLNDQSSDGGWLTVSRLYSSWENFWSCRLNLSYRIA